MTKARDIGEIINEHAPRAGERKALEHLADTLEETLTADVPYRPAFKAELRRRLMAGARRTVTPWYRRPTAWGSALGVAAAAAVLVVGIQVWRDRPPGLSAQNVPPAAPTPAEPLGVPQVIDQPVPFVPVLTSDVNLPAVSVPDEALGPDIPGPMVVTDAVLQRGLPVIRLTGRPDEQLFRDMASRLGLWPLQVNGGGWLALQGSRRLEVTPDGQVLYSDGGAQTQGSGAAEGMEGARQVARRFLDLTLLPVHDLQPVVTEGPFDAINHLFTVTYTQRVEGWPVVNARTAIRVTDRGAVARADAYVQSGYETGGTYAAVPMTQALAAARAQGGSFEQADLVWVRTVSDQAVYLQPYWRVFGLGEQGNRLIRYVPALKR